MWTKTKLSHGFDHKLIIYSTWLTLYTTQLVVNTILLSVPCGHLCGMWTSLLIYVFQSNPPVQLALELQTPWQTEYVAYVRMFLQQLFKVLKLPLELHSRWREVCWPRIQTPHTAGVTAWWSFPSPIPHEHHVWMPQHTTHSFLRRLEEMEPPSVSPYQVLVNTIIKQLLKVNSPISPLI